MFNLIFDMLVEEHERYTKKNKIVTYIACVFMVEMVLIKEAGTISLNIRGRLEIKYFCVSRSKKENMY